jgi:hypothetical protein
VEPGHAASIWIKFPLFSEGVVDRKVFGTVLSAAGVAQVDITVQIDMETLDGGTVSIGEAETDSDGRYELTFDPEDFNPQIMRVSLSGVSGTPSQVVAAPAWNEEVNFRLGTLAGARVARFTDVSRRLSEVLAPSQTDVADLDTVGVARASVLAGIPPAETALWREALISSDLSEVPDTLFFALGQAGLSAAVASATKHSPHDWSLALQRAAAMGILSPEDQTVAQEALADLTDVMIDSALQTPTLIANPGQALTLAGITDPELRKETLAAWVSSNGDPVTFWSGVSGLSAGEKEDVQFALHLDKITRSNAPMVAALFGDYDSLEELVALDLSDWFDLADTHDVPSFLSGVTKAQYAQAMFNVVEDAFPTQMLAARSAGFTGGTAIAAFLAGNSVGNAPYDLAGQSLRQFLVEHPDAIEEAGDEEAQAAVRAELPVLERLYRVSPRGARFETMLALRSEGFTSATQIALMGRARFMGSMGQVIGPTASEVFARAKAASSVALMLQMVHGSPGAYTRMSVLPIRREDPLEGVESPKVQWDALFGGRTYCSCRECQSAHGPAAYLADLLFWLWARGTDGAFTDALFARRGDISTLDLSCKNSHTPLPTIDLILERLERLVVSDAGPTPQTGLDAAELAARPEHVLAGAYARVAGAGEHPRAYPFEQPYVAPLDQSRTFLEQLGLSRASAMLALATEDGPSALATSEVAAEYLGMTRASWQFLTTTGDAADTARRWGYRTPLLGAHPAWTRVEAEPVVTAIPSAADPEGGERAVVLQDDSAVAAVAWQVQDVRYRGGPIAGGLRVKKLLEASHGIQVRVGIDGDYSDTDLAFYFDPYADPPTSGSWHTAVLTDGWYSITIALDGVPIGDDGSPSASSIGLRVLPAATDDALEPDVTLNAHTTVVFDPRLESVRDIDELKVVATFLRQAGRRDADKPLSYAELEDLLRSRYVQDAGGLSIEFADKTCDIDGALLVSSSWPAHLNRLAKLIRLSRDLGWSIRDLDRAVAIFRVSSPPTLAESDVSETLLRSLASVTWLAKTLRTEVTSVLDWFGPLDTRRWMEQLMDDPAPPEGGWGRVPNLSASNAGAVGAEPSPFQRLARLHGITDLLAVTNDGSELQDDTRALSEHLDAVSGLLGAGRRDVATLLTVLPAEPHLNLANLSVLNRWVSFARALGLSVSDLLVWSGRLAGDLFSSPATVVQLTVEVSRQRQMRLGPAALDTLLGAPGTRDLSNLGLPSAGVAFLSLADDVRKHSAVGTSDVFDPTLLAEHNLLPTPPGWTPTNATVTTGKPDPFGGTDAVTIDDASPSETGTAVSSAVSDYTLLAPVWVTIWIQKDPGAAHPCELALEYGGVETVRISVNLATGKRTAVTPSELDYWNEARDAGTWWMLSFAHAGSNDGQPRLVVRPAVGTEATGAVTVYGARIAASLLVSGEDRPRRDPASPVYEYAARDRAIVRRVAALLGLDVTLTNRLLRLARYPDGDGDVPVFEPLLQNLLTIAGARASSAVATAGPEALADMSVDLDVWEFIAVIGWICRALTIRVEELPWLFEISEAVREFNVEDIAAASETADRYQAWSRLREAARLQIVSGRRLYDLLGTLATATLNAAGAREKILAGTGWEATDLAAAIGDDFRGPLNPGPAAANASTWASPTLFGRLVRWMELARSLNTPASSLLGPSAIEGLGWAQCVWPDLDDAQLIAVYTRHAAETESAVRARWGPERWLSDMPTVRERLRERQRAGLLSYLVGENPYSAYSSADAIGETLLMDVQTGGCARTSRVKDAIRTVQVFVQRILAGAEPGLSLTEEEAREWVWRKSYRLWEANRKVFLYPENWLRPELRRNKTPIFKTFEAELAGGEISTDLVESAYRTYLRKLSEVAKLDILAIHDTQEDGEDVHRVFGRTRGLPQQYFFRERRRGQWSPWVDVPGISGEHLIPVVFNRRPLLLTLDVNEAGLAAGSVAVGSLAEPVETRPPPHYFSIYLSWSELRDGRWSSPTKSETVFGVDERGRFTVPGGVLGWFVSSAEGKSFRPKSIYGEATISGHDLVVDIRLTRDRASVRTSGVLLGRLRLSGVDGSVAVEGPGSSFVPNTVPPETPDGIPYASAAQRLTTRVVQSGEPRVGLSVALPHAGSPSGASVTLLATDSATIGEWAQVTSSSRISFDATKPFVFEDSVGSYWATYRPQRYVDRIAFPGSFWHGSDIDLRLAPPAARDLPEGRVVLVDADVQPFRTLSDKGADALIGDDTLQQIRTSGKHIVSVNGSAADLAPVNWAVTSSMEVVDPDGEAIVDLRYGLKWGSDRQWLVAMKFDAVAVPLEQTLYKEGFQIFVQPRAKWRFETFFHPHVALMRGALNQHGPFGLLQPPLQSDGSGGPLATQDPQPESTLATRYATTNGLVAIPLDDLDFSGDGAYSQYNWELFFHAPVLIATRLHEAGRFEEALKWLRTVFDPYRPAQAGAEDDEAVRSAWRFRPFREAFPDGEELPRNIQDLVALLSASADDEAATAAATGLLQQIRDWRRNPFDPHAIARTRTITYMTWVVKTYLTILLDWGDQLFTRDTLESIGEATEYYLMAARILGVRPEEIEKAADPTDPQTFAAMLTEFQGGETPAMAIEEALAVPTWTTEELEAATDDASSLATLLHFCVPANAELKVQLWDRVADRLFKVRNCLDIQGRKRELALFEPPIDPDLLVRAAAAGIDLRSALAEIVTGRVPHRRYLAMADLASGLAASANALGQALLAAIEKRDADQLNTVRAKHEKALHVSTIQARSDQIADLEHQIAALRISRDATQRRWTYYLQRQSTPMNRQEVDAQNKARLGKDLLDAGGATSAAAGLLGLVPDFKFGVSGLVATPVAIVSFGGTQLSLGARAVGHVLEASGQAFDRESRMLLADAGYTRRTEEWTHQADMAKSDLDATERRILGTEIQIAMAKNALAAAELRMEQIDEVLDTLQRRFAKEELFEVLAAELSTLHFQSYQLAYEFAKKAESAWRYELGRADTFIQFGYWDSRRKGLLAADTLAHDLRRMQVAYLELSSRRLEVDQTFSLREIDPLALLRLQRLASAEFSLPEAFFDLSYPGHFGRRIRAVRFTIPAVVPPNTNLPAHVELRHHSIRKTDSSDDTALVEGGYGNAPVAMTATSTGQRDAGVFELDFKGPKLLPFEGAGAVSAWHLSLPSAVRTFRYTDIHDVLVHVAYDAEYSGGLRMELEQDSPPKVFSNLFDGDPVPRRRAISMRQEHGAALRRFVQAANSDPQVEPFSVSFEIGRSAVASYIAEALDAETLRITEVKIVLTAAHGELALTLNTETPLNIGDPPPDPPVFWNVWTEAAGLPAATFEPEDVFPPPSPPTTSTHRLFGTHTLSVTDWGTFKPDEGFDILLVLEFAEPA